MKESDEKTTYTVLEYLSARVKFDIPKEALEAIMADRGIDSNTEFASRDIKATRLAYADMLKWYLIGASKHNNKTDSDNGWSHSGGGYELDKEDKKLLVKEANAIYDELEPMSKIKSNTTFRVMSFGIQPCNYDADGNPLPHIIR